MNYSHNDYKIKDKISTFIDYRSSARLVLYKSTFKLIKDHLLLGVGPGNWKIDTGCRKTVFQCQYPVSIRAVSGA